MTKAEGQHFTNVRRIREWTLQNWWMCWGSPQLRSGAVGDLELLLRYHRSIQCCSFNTIILKQWVKFVFFESYMCQKIPKVFWLPIKPFCSDTFEYSGTVEFDSDSCWRYQVWSQTQMILVWVKGAGDCPYWSDQIDHIGYCGFLPRKESLHLWYLSVCCNDELQLVLNPNCYHLLAPLEYG